MAKELNLGQKFYLALNDIHICCTLKMNVTPYIIYTEILKKDIHVCKQQ